MKGMHWGKAKLTPRQAEIREAVQRHGSIKKAAKALGITPGYVNGTLVTIRTKERHRANYEAGLAEKERINALKTISCKNETAGNETE